MAKPLIRLSDITKVYSTGDLEIPVLTDISLTINTGEFVAIMGPSGSGKSTLMHILGALDVPTGGTYILGGQNIERLSEDKLAEIRNTKIGFVFQAYNLLPRISALDNVMLPMDYAGVCDDEQKERAVQMLAMVGLSDRMEHTSNRLSGGQQQRVAIARALVMEPSILLADEPTGNIASTQAKEIMNIFRDLHTKGHTIVMITHERDLADHAERIIHLLDGRIVEDGNGNNKGRIQVR